jgi:MoaA/NifB/PqqE/SkfB family radical SAM enzyme
MSVRELAVRQAAKRMLPLVSRMSDKDLEKVLSIAAKFTPNEFAGSIISSLQEMCRQQHPSVEFFRRIVRQSSPHVRERLMNSFVIKNHWYGTVRRDELRNKEGVSIPNTFLISPTMRCNLRCSNCYAANYDMKDDLEFEVIDRVLTEGEDLGIFFVTILGGEPFIRPDLWEIYRRHSDILFHVYTNGTLVNKEVARRLAELGNMIILFSLEGFEEETDARRGKGVFQKVMQGMDNLMEAGVIFGYSVMVTSRNVETVVSDEFNDMLIEKGCLFGWHFLYIPSGAGPDVSLMPSAEQRELMRLRGAQRIREEKPILVFDFWNDAPYVGGCIAAGRHFFHINSRGDAEPCIFVHLATDNIKEKSLREILNSPYFKGIRSRQPYGDNLLRPCMIIDQPCVLRDVCDEFHPFPTHEGAETMVTTLCSVLDRYSEEAAKVLDPAWERDFISRGFIPPEIK